MLVDLARNDVNRVCDPLTTRVDKLMVVQKVKCFRPSRDRRMWCNEGRKRWSQSGNDDANEMETSFRTCSTWCRKYLAYCDLARRDSTRSARYFPLVSSATKKT